VIITCDYNGSFAILLYLLYYIRDIGISIIRYIYIYIYIFLNNGSLIDKLIVIICGICNFHDSFSIM